MDFTKIIYEKKDGIGFITLNDPENRNAISHSVISDEFEQCIDDCSIDPIVRVVILRGAGVCFSAGGNVKHMITGFDKGEFDYGPQDRKWGIIIAKIRTIRKPVIASLHGSVAGGALSLALACDFRIAAEDTKFIFAFVNLGLVPDMGGAFTLVKMLGVAKATELMMTAKLFSGKEACAWGLVNEAVSPDQLEETTMTLANKLAKGPTLAYGAIKAMVNQVSFGGFDLFIDTEAEYQQMLSYTVDHREGVSSFLEKRKPIFKAR